MSKKIIVSALMAVLISCTTAPDFSIMSESEIEQSLTDISVGNIHNLIEENRYLKAVQLILSVDKGSPDYSPLNKKLPMILSEMDGILRKSIESENYRDALKYYNSFLSLDMNESVEEYNLEELQFKYVNQLFKDGADSAAVSYFYNNLTYSRLTAEQLDQLEDHFLKSQNKGALEDLFEYYVKSSLNAKADTVRLLNEPKTMERMIKGTVTVWVNKGIKIENGIGYPDRVIGSGFFIDKNGHILTNYHVISSEVDPEYEGFSRLYIKLSGDSDERIPAKVIGWDKDFDIALLKAEVKPEYIFSISKRYEPEMGDKIFAIGSPGGLKNTMTSGSVSSLSRQLLPMGDSLQIDVPINPGNSGGPLLNSKGEVIGIIFAGIEQFEGVNFAIPVSDVKESLPDLYRGGRVTHPWLGCGLFERTGKLEVLYVLPGSPAFQIGLKKGDIIQKLNGVEYSAIADIQRALLKYDTETLVKVEWIDKDKNHSAVVSLDERPENPMEIALNKDTVDNLFVPFFGMEVERIRGRGNKNVLYSLKDVYPGLTADESGLSVGDTLLLRKWLVDEENKVLIIQIIMKSRKAGFIESAVQVGTYISKGFLI